MFAWRTDFASVAKMCSNGEVDALSNVLLKKPRMVEETSKTGATLLHIACHRGRLDICIVLLLKGAKIDCVDDMGFTPLMVCAQFKQSDCARMLIARGADVNMVNKRRQTALHIAAIFGSSDIIPPLLDNSAEINGVDIDGCTAVMLAAGRCHDPIVTTLVKYDCDVLIEDNSKNSALSLARENGLHVSTVNSIIFHREMQMVERHARQEEKAKLNPKSSFSSGRTQRSQGRSVTFGEYNSTTDGSRAGPASAPASQHMSAPGGLEAEASPIAAIKRKKKKDKKDKKDKNRNTSAGGKPSGEISEAEESTGMAEQKSLEEGRDGTKEGGSQGEVLPTAGGGPMDRGGLPALPASEGNITATTMDLNNAHESPDSSGTANKTDGFDGSDKKITASKAETEDVNRASEAVLEMERRLQVMGLRDSDEGSPLPAAGGGGQGQGGIAPEFEGSAVSSLTMNSLASHVLQKKRNRERDIARRNGHLSPEGGGSNAVCWNPVGCLDDQSVGQIQTATDLWLLYKAEEARGNTGRAQYLKNLAMRKDEEEKDRRAAAAAAAAAAAKAAAQEVEAKANAARGGSGRSLDHLWCLSPVVDEEEESASASGEQGPSRETKPLVDAYAGPPGERVGQRSERGSEGASGSGEGKKVDIRGSLDKQQQQQDREGGDNDDVVVDGDGNGDGDEDEDEDDELLNLGQWVPSGTTRKIDPNRPMSKADMMKRKRRLQKRERKQQIAARMSCMEAPPPDRNTDSSKGDYLIRARANEDRSHNSADDQSCSIV